MSESARVNEQHQPGQLSDLPLRDLELNTDGNDVKGGATLPSATGALAPQPETPVSPTSVVDQKSWLCSN